MRQFFSILSLLMTAAIPAAANDVSAGKTLADTIVDCSYTCTRYVIAGQELGMDMGRTMLSCGMFGAAAETMTSADYVEARTAELREKFYASIEEDQSLADSEKAIRNRQLYDRLAVDYRVCGAVAKQHNDVLAPKIRQYLDARKTKNY